MKYINKLRDGQGGTVSWISDRLKEHLEDGVLKYGDHITMLSNNMGSYVLRNDNENRTFVINGLEPCIGVDDAD